MTEEWSEGKGRAAITLPFVFYAEEITTCHLLKATLKNDSLCE